MKTETLKVKIEVTPTNIKKGIFKSWKSCPIALAVKRVFGRKISNLSVGNEISFTLTRRGKEQDFSADVPKRASTFIDKFDNRGTVKPFAFTLKAVAV